MTATLSRINHNFLVKNENIMKQMEQLELEAYRSEIVADMSSLLEKYRRIFGWDIPEVAESAADKLILAAMRKALEEIENKFLEDEI
jgi:hypothetical protein